MTHKHETPEGAVAIDWQAEVDRYYKANVKLNNENARLRAELEACREAISSMAQLVK